MHRPNRTAARLVRLLIPTLLGAAALGACSDQQPVAPREPTSTARPPTARTLQAFDCTGSRTVPLSCKPAGGSADGASGNILGGSGIYLKLTSSNISYDSLTEVFQFDVTVQNLMNEAMGTPDGVTPDPQGIRVFFDTVATVVEGTGTMTLLNHDGEDFFKEPGQPYFAYHEILPKDAVSAPRTWQFEMSPTVEVFKFTVLVETDMQYLLVINEVLVNPGGTISDANGEWFEIHNAGTLSVNLQNVVIADSSASGRRPYHQIASSVKIPGGGYATLGGTTNTTNNGGVVISYAYGSALALANSFDAIKIARVYGTDTLTLDRVAFASAAISGRDGISRELTSPALDNANVDGSSWADALPTTRWSRSTRRHPPPRHSACSRRGSSAWSARRRRTCSPPPARRRCPRPASPRSARRTPSSYGSAGASSAISRR